MAKAPRVNLAPYQQTSRYAKCLPWPADPWSQEVMRQIVRERSNEALALAQRYGLPKP